MKLKILRITLFITTIVVGLTSCSVSKNHSRGNSNSPILGEWKLIDISDVKAKSLTEAYPDGLPTLNIISEKNIHAYDGCNLINGGVKINKNQISFGNLLSTLKACGNVEDTNFSTKLQGNFEYKLVGNKLELLKDNIVILSFIRSSTTTIEGSWVLEEFIGRDRSIKSIKDRFPNEIPTLKFTKNIITGNNGCNNINAEYSTEGKSLHIGKTSETAMACSKVDSEAFMDRFKRVNKYEIERDKLILSENKIKTMVFKRK